jgi:hypothetical protein
MSTRLSPNGTSFNVRCVKLFAQLTTFFLTLLLTCASNAQQRPTPVSVLILDGESVEIYHGWELTTSILKAELESTGRFDVTVRTAPRFGTDFGSFDPHFERYKVVVWNYDAPDWPGPLKTELETYLRDGGGMVVVHAADNAFPHWEEFNKMIGIGGWRDRDEHSGPMWHYDQDKLVSDKSPGKAGKHGKRLPFLVETVPSSTRSCGAFPRHGCTRRTSSTALCVVREST